jgi:hypothetical protein
VTDLRLTVFSFFETTSERFSAGSGHLALRPLRRPFMVIWQIVSRWQIAECD